MAKKLTNIEFLEKCKNTHGSIYDYSKTEYINTRTKIKIICKIHGEFELLPDNHLGKQKQGCVTCARDNHKLTEISNGRLNKLKEIHNNYYLYNDLSINNTKIKITCPEHGDFEQSIYLHEKGSKCPLCVGNGFKLTKLSIERLNKLKEVHNNYYTYKDLSINKGYISIICPKHGEFKQQLHLHEKGTDCKTCALEKRSIKVKEFNKLNPKNLIINGEKACIDCGEFKQLNMFPLRIKNDINSYRNQCIICFYERQKIIDKNYRQDNKRKLLDYDKQYRKNRMETDPLYKVIIIARSVIRKAITNSGYSKKSHTYEILGCSYEEFKIHLENQFIGNMTWENRNEWHIDHIIPLSFGKTEEEIIMLNHFSNLRPLWGTENEEKSNKITIKNDIYYEILENRKQNKI